MDTVQQIKTRLDIVDIIKDYLPLQKAGVNYKTPCPFHSEKTPSFFVSSTRQSWHCFGCGLGGDVFSFVQRMEGLEFPEALRILAQRAGVELKEYRAKTRTKRNNFLDIMEAATLFYQKVLLEHPKATEPRDYLRQRGLTEESIHQFKLGYAPPTWDSLVNYITAQKFPLQDAMKVGLLSKKERGGAYDRFRGRLMFPIRDVNGQIIGFGGRVFLEDEKVSAKYINSPQSDLYDKSRVLYGLHDARFDIKEANMAVVVEGYFDLIMSHQAGVRNAVAVSGTALTEEHVRLLKRYTDTVALCFDADDAGARATERSFQVALRQGLQVLVVDVPTGKDPADCVRQDPQLWHDAVKNARKYLDYVISIAVPDLTSSDITRKKNGVSYVFSILKNATSRIEQMHYIKQLSELVFISEKILWEEFSRIAPRTQQRASVRKESDVPIMSVQSAKVALSNRLLALLVWALERDDKLAGLSFPEDFAKYMDNTAQKLYKTLSVSYNNGRSAFEISSDLSEQYRIVSMLADREFADITEKQARMEAQICKGRLREAYLKSHLFDIQKNLKVAEVSGNSEEIARLLEMYQKLRESE